LTIDELFEIGARAGFQEGEIGDAIRQTTTRYFGQEKILPDRQTLTWMGAFAVPSNPEYRNFTALDLVVSELRDCVKAVGAARAGVDRSGIVERAVAQRIPRNDIEAAIAILMMSGTLVENDGSLKFAPGREGYTPPSQHRPAGLHDEPKHDEMRARAYSIVKDVIERRTDSRPKHAEPLDAFVEELGTLGYRPFRSWWIQIVSELRRADTQSSPVSVIVLAAALVEGALTFVVKHAQGFGLGVLGSKDFVRDPRQWRIDDLVSSATAGGNTAILDIATRQRADALIHTRQRIHAGRMLSEFPAGPPDLRPEEAREAKATSELVVRRILVWLENYPPQQTRKG
jgi:hypothetical protein